MNDWLGGCVEPKVKTELCDEFCEFWLPNTNGFDASGWEAEGSGFSVIIDESEAAG